MSDRPTGEQVSSDDEFDRLRRQLDSATRDAPAQSELERISREYERLVRPAMAEAERLAAESQEIDAATMSQWLRRRKPAAGTTTDTGGRRRRARPRSFDLDQAVRIARELLGDTPPRRPTVALIADAIADEEASSLTESGLTSRWQRHKRRGGSITLEEVLALATRP